MALGNGQTAEREVARTRRNAYRAMASGAGNALLYTTRSVWNFWFDHYKAQQKPGYAFNLSHCYNATGVIALTAIPAIITLIKSIETFTFFHPEMWKAVNAIFKPVGEKFTRVLRAQNEDGAENTAAEGEQAYYRYLFCSVGGWASMLLWVPTAFTAYFILHANPIHAMKQSLKQAWNTLIYNGENNDAETKQEENPYQYAHSHHKLVSGLLTGIAAIGTALAAVIKNIVHLIASRVLTKCV